MGLALQKGITACAGVEVFLQSDGSLDLRLVGLSLQKKLIHIEQKKEYQTSLEQIRTLGIKGPVAISLTGRGVLIKKTSRLESITEQSLRHLFPSFKPEEFYAQHFSSGDQSYVAFVRKEIADPIIAAFSRFGAEILLFSLGPFVVSQVVPQLNNYNGSLNFDGHQVVMNSELDWLDYSYAAGSDAAFELKIDSEVIPQQFLVAYAAAFQLLLHDRLELVEVEAEEISNALAALTSKLKFQQQATVALFSFFGLLLLNFLLFSFYNTQNQELAGRAGQRSNQFTDRRKLESDVKEKELQVKKIGWNHGQHYAFLCDQIGQTVPATVVLNELTINRLKGSNMEQASTGGAETGVMKITGQSASVYVINDWIYALKQKAWVKNVQLERYATDEQKGTQVFTLRLNY